MSDKLPPKIMPQQVKSISVQRPVDLAKPGSLPVLEAFQEFIQVERRQNRHRMVMLTVFFLLVFVAAFALLLLLGAGNLNRVRADMKRMRDQVQTLDRTHGQLQEDTRTMLEKLSDQAGQIQNAMADEQKNIAATRGQLVGKISSIDEELLDLRAVITELETQNSALKTNLASIQRRAEEAAYRPPAPPPVEQPAMVTPPARINFTPFSVPVQVPGKNFEVPVQMLIPE
jgi:hypothetical protein